MAKSIFLEGIDGCGKGTQISLLADYLRQQGHELLLLREPGGSEYFEAIRESVHFKDYDRPAISDTFLTAAGRAANIEETKQAIADGKWVLSDRAYPSTFAYQAADGVSWEMVKAINDIALNGFEYDYKILLDLPIEVASTRLGDGKRDRWEGRGSGYFEKVRRNYQRLAEERNIHIIDADQSIDQIHQQIVQIIQQ